MDTTCCSVLSEALRSGLKPCVSSWHGGGADEECGVRIGVVISKVLVWNRVSHSAHVV